MPRGNDSKICHLRWPTRIRLPFIFLRLHHWACIATKSEPQQYPEIKECGASGGFLFHRMKAALSSDFARTGRKRFWNSANLFGGFFKVTGRSVPHRHQLSWCPSCGRIGAAGQRKSAFGAPDQGNSTRIADSISGKARSFSDSQSELPFPL